MYTSVYLCICMCVCVCVCVYVNAYTYMSIHICIINWWLSYVTNKRSEIQVHAPKSGLRMGRRYNNTTLSDNDKEQA